MWSRARGTYTYDFDPPTRGNPPKQQPAATSKVARRNPPPAAAATTVAARPVVREGVADLLGGGGSVELQTSSSSSSSVAPVAVVPRLERHALAKSERRKQRTIEARKQKIRGLAVKDEEKKEEERRKLEIEVIVARDTRGQLLGLENTEKGGKQRRYISAPWDEEEVDEEEEYLKEIEQQALLFS
jgi:hypothetical protein